MKNNCDTVTVIADSISKLFNFLKSKELQRPWLCLQSQERCNFLQNYPLKSLKKHAWDASFGGFLCFFCSLDGINVLIKWQQKPWFCSHKGHLRPLRCSFCANSSSFWGYCETELKLHESRNCLFYHELHEFHELATPMKKWKGEK